MNLEVEDWTSQLTRTPDRGFVLTIDYVSKAEINCTSRAEGNCTTERLGCEYRHVVVCKGFGLVSRLMLVCLPALLEAEALSVHLLDVDMVCKAVRERDGTSPDIQDRASKGYV